MSDFLQRLAERTSGLAPVAQPIIAPMFAPEPITAGAAPTLLEIDEVVESPSSLAHRHQVMQRAVTQALPPEGRATGQFAPRAEHSPGNTPVERIDRAVRAPHVQEIPRSKEAHAMPIQAISHDVVTVPVPEIFPSPAQPGPLLNNSSITGTAKEHQPALSKQRAPSSIPMLETTAPAPQSFSEESITSEESASVDYDLAENASNGKYGVALQAPVAMEYSPALFRREEAFSSAPEQISPPNQTPQGLTASHIIQRPHPVTSFEPPGERQERYENALPPQQPGTAHAGEASRGESIELPSPRPPQATFQASATPRLLVPQLQPGDLPQALPAHHDATTFAQAHSPQEMGLGDGTPEVQVAPTIRITIGRVDVRAVSAPTPPHRQKSPRTTPALSLEQYARQNRERR